MNEKNPYSPETWHQFLELLGPDIESLSQDEIRQILADMKIDTSSTIDRVRKRIQMHSDRVKLEQAAENRQRLLKKVFQPVFDLNLSRAELLEMIRGLSPKLAGVYMNRMEHAATDEELRSLVEDLQQAKAIQEQQEEDDGTKET